MTPDQISKSIGFSTHALQMAIVHLGTILETKGVISRDELAKTFESTAQLLRPDLEESQLTEQIFVGIAHGLRIAANVSTG